LRWPTNQMAWLGEPPRKPKDCGSYQGLKKENRKKSREKEVRKRRNEKYQMEKRKEDKLSGNGSGDKKRIRINSK